MFTRSSLIGGGVAALAALIPAVASAATTYTVDPAAAAGCSGTTCKTITAANAAVADGDTVSIKAGTYAEATIAVTKNNVTFTAADPGRVVVATSTATAGASTFTLGDGSGAGKGTVLSGLTIGVPATGGPAVSVQATDTKVTGASLARTGSTSDAPVYEVVDTGSGVTSGTNTLAASFVVNFQGPTDAGTAAAVRGGGRTSLVLEDDIVVSGAKAGPGVAFTANDRETTGTMAAIPNRITRGTVIAQNPSANAVEVSSADGSAVPKSTTLDSVVLAPGTSGAGLRAASTNGAVASAGSTAGNVTVTANHVTIAGGARPFALDAAALSAPPVVPPALGGTANAAVGTVAVNVDRSIVHGSGASTATASATSTVSQTGSTARLTIKDSDTTDAAGGTAAAGTTVSGTTTTADAVLFRSPAGRDYHLRAGAPVIDQGGAQVAGESTTDFEGQPRVNGAAADRGADEFVNTGPAVKLSTDRTAVKQGETVSFDASASSDIDGEGLRYFFNYGDGSPVEQSATGKVSHTYAKAGTFTAGVAALDGANAVGGTGVQITVADGTPPKVALTSPKSGAKLKLFTLKTTRKALKAKGGRKRTQLTTTRTLRKIVFSGTSSDDTALRSTELSIRRVSTTKSRAKEGRTTKVVTAKAAAANCVYLDPKAKTFVTKACSKPVFFVVPVKGGTFSYQLKKGTGLRPGSYVITVRATDSGGTVSAPVDLPFKLT